MTDPYGDGMFERNNDDDQDDETEDERPYPDHPFQVLGAESGDTIDFYAEPKEAAEVALGMAEDDNEENAKVVFWRKHGGHAHVELREDGFSVMDEDGDLISEQDNDEPVAASALRDATEDVYGGMFTDDTPATATGSNTKHASTVAGDAPATELPAPSDMGRTNGIFSVTFVALGMTHALALALWSTDTISNRTAVYTLFAGGLWAMVVGLVLSEGGDN